MSWTEKKLSLPFMGADSRGSKTAQVSHLSQQQANEKKNILSHAFIVHPKTIYNPLNSNTLVKLGFKRQNQSRSPSRLLKHQYFLCDFFCKLYTCNFRHFTFPGGECCPWLRHLGWGCSCHQDCSPQEAQGKQEEILCPHRLNAFKSSQIRVLR